MRDGDLRGSPRVGHRAATDDGSCNRKGDRAKGLVGARLYGEGMSSITRSIVGPEVSAGSLSQIATPFLDPRVTLDGDRVRALATTLRRGASESEYQPLLWDDDRFWLTIASPEERSQFMAVGNALNFRFWELADGDGVSAAGGRLDGEYLVGSMYMWRRLRLVLERDEFPLLDAQKLARLEPDQLRALLADDEGGDPLAPGFDDRLANLRDLGAVLSRDWGGQFNNLLAVADDDLETFFALSATVRAYDDPLRKLSTVNAIMLSGSGLTQFRQTIPPAIDYHVAKQLLRIGAVRVALPVEADLSTSNLLDPDVAMAIRATSLIALEQVCALADLPGDIVDNVLWSNRRVCAEPTPICSACPLLTACGQRVAIQRPLELTRYY
jgi:hypothetical protein